MCWLAWKVVFQIYFGCTVNINNQEVKCFTCWLVCAGQVKQMELPIDDELTEPNLFGFPPQLIRSSSISLARYLNQSDMSHCF